MYKPLSISQDCCAKLFYQVPYVSKQLFWLLNSPQTISPNKVIKYPFSRVFLDSILHQSKLNQFIMSPPSQPGEPTENICGVFTPAAIWQLHCGSQSQRMLQGRGQLLGHPAGGWNRPLDAYFGKLAWKSGDCWDGRRVEHWAEDWISWEELDGSEYNETDPEQIHKDSVLLLCPQPQQQRHEKCSYQGWSCGFLMCDWHLEWPLSFLHPLQAREALAQSVPGKSVVQRFSSHTLLESRLTTDV